MSFGGIIKSLLKSLGITFPIVREAYRLYLGKPLLMPKLGYFRYI